MEFLIIRALVVAIGSALGAFTDLKTGLILDKITYPMLAIGIILNLVELIGIGFTTESLGMYFGLGLIIFVFGYAFYFSGKIGGGDVKLLTAIAFLMPWFGEQFFVLNVLFIAMVSAVVVLGAYYLIKYAKKGITLEDNKSGLRKALFFAVIIAVYFYAINLMGFLSINMVLFIGIPVIFALIFLALEQGIRKHFFLEFVDIEKLEEDEIIASEYLKEKTKKELSLFAKGVLGKKEIERLRALGENKIPVYRNLPKFGIFIFIGVVASLIWPNIIAILLV